MNWQELSATSHYKTALAIQHELQHSHFPEADKGIQELINALSRSEKRALKRQIIRLMKHIIKWKTQSHYRSRNWIATIYNARSEIRDIQEETPSLNNDVVSKIWEDCVSMAIVEAEDEMRQDAIVGELSWQEVFEEQYSLGLEN